MGFQGKIVAPNSLPIDRIITAGYVPSAADDLTNVAYVTALFAGLSPKGEAKASTTGNINLNSPPSVFDTYSPADGEVILVQFQNNDKQNGLYDYHAGGMVRSSNFNTTVTVGAYVLVDNGALYGGWGFFVSGIPSSGQTIVVGTDDIVWSIYQKPNAYIGGDGITINANQINLGGTFANDINLDGAHAFNIGLTTKPTSFRVFAGGGDYAQLFMGSTSASMNMTIGGNTVGGVTFDANGTGIAGPNGLTSIQVGGNANLLITDNRSGVNAAGIQYFANYAANFTARSLVDKAYVDAAVAGGSFTLTNGNGTTAAGTAVNLGGTLTADANVDGGFGVNWGATTSLTGFTVKTIDSTTRQTVMTVGAGSAFDVFVSDTVNLNIFGEIGISPSGFSAFVADNTISKTQIQTNYNTILFYYVDAANAISQNSIQIENTGLSIVYSNLANGFNTEFFVEDNIIILQGDDPTFGGAVYHADYSANFGLRSLVDKGYVTAAISAIPTFALTNGNGTTAAGTAVNLGGTLTADAAINGAHGLDFGNTTKLTHFSFTTYDSGSNATAQTYSGGNNWTLSVNDDTTNDATFLQAYTTGISMIANSGTDGTSSVVAVSNNGLSQTVGIYHNSGLSYNTAAIVVSKNAITIGDGGSNLGIFPGAVYDKDYSAFYTNRSLVDKAYVDNAVTGGGITSGSGITLVAGAVNLGGALNQTATITGTAFDVFFGDPSGINSFNVNTIGNFSAYTSNGTIGLTAGNGHLQFSSNVGSAFATIEVDASNGGFKIQDGRTGVNQTGIVYTNDYSANFVARSLVDKAYVDSKSVTYGAATLIPFVNATANGFSYSTGLTFDAANSNIFTNIANTGSSAANIYTLAGPGYINNTYVFGEANVLSTAVVGNAVITDTMACGFGNFIGDGLNSYSGTSSFTYGNFNNMYGGGLAGGFGAQVSYGGTGGVAISLDGAPSISGSVRDNAAYKWVIAAGNAFNISHNSAAQTTTQGALASYSVILGGQDHHIPSTSARSAIIGGNGIVARASDPDQIYVPNLNIAVLPLNDDALTEVLVRDSGTGQIKYRNASSFSGGTIGVPQNSDKDRLSAATSGNGQTTGLAISHTPTGLIIIALNGEIVSLGDGVKTKKCYFSADGGTTAKTYATIVATDVLYWNGVIASYDLTVIDKFDFYYI